MARERTSQVFRDSDKLQELYRSSNPSKNKRRKKHAHKRKDPFYIFMEEEQDRKAKQEEKEVALRMERRQQIEEMMSAMQQKQQQWLLQQQQMRQQLVARTRIHRPQQPCIEYLRQAQQQQTTQAPSSQVVATAGSPSYTVPGTTVNRTINGGGGGAISAVLAAATASQQRVSWPSLPLRSTVLARGERNMAVKTTPYDPGLYEETAATVAGLPNLPATTRTAAQMQRALSLDTGISRMNGIRNNHKMSANKGIDSSTALARGPSPVPSNSLPPAKRAKTSGDTNDGGITKPKPSSDNQKITIYSATAAALSERSEPHDSMNNVGGGVNCVQTMDSSNRGAVLAATESPCAASLRSADSLITTIRLSQQAIDEKQDAIEERQDAIEERQDAIEKSMETISDYLRTIDEKLDTVLDAGLCDRLEVSDVSTRKSDK